MGRTKLTTMVGLAFLATLVVMLPQVYAKRFIVGGNMGWTSNVNYTIWAANQTFYFGDWLFFVYDRNRDDVLEVNKTSYGTCNAEHLIHNYTTGAGRDVVPLNVTHDRYFISSKGSCDGGMKLHVHLTPLPPPPGGAPSDSPKSSSDSAPRFNVLKSQLIMLHAIVTIVVIWDSLLSI
uniref:lamin-like protein n=1 Tax=Erigeron canadensis TaxID=72917 RepID=UPI001CB8CAB5|nr:lamin-like protein [Erigeron canadensis]